MAAVDRTMDHLLLRVGRRSLLMVTPAESSLGKAVGYGGLIWRVDEAFHVAHGFGARLLMLRPRHALNPALFDLTSPTAPTLSPAGVAASALRIVWWASTPVRYGAPVAWAGSVLGREIRRLAGLAVLAVPERSVRRKSIKRVARRLERWGHAHVEAYARRVRQLWASRLKEAGRRARKAQRAGRLGALSVTLRQEMERTAARLAATMGISADSVIVCLHVREAGYRAALGLRQPAAYDERSAQIEDYFPAIDWLVSKGAIVVRVGDSTMTPVARAGVVDLATMPARTPELELWCVRRCKLFIVCDSGPNLFGRLFKVPLLATNVIQFTACVWAPWDRYVFKHAVDQATARRLSLFEMLDESYLAHAYDQRYGHEDNAPEDILAAVQECWQLLHGCAVASPAQEAFEQKLAAVARQWPGRSVNPRTALPVTPGRGRIAASFADRYFDATGSLVESRS
ncbi:MAG: TIGR04372 family glycosyltransferase [Acidobacteriota bacterium]